MNLDEAKEYLETANLMRPLGLSWDIIARMQRSGKIRMNVAKIRAKGRPCHRCGKASGSVGLLPTCKKCQKTQAL